MVGFQKGGLRCRVALFLSLSPFGTSGFITRLVHLYLLLHLHLFIHKRTRVLMVLLLVLLGICPPT